MALNKNDVYLIVRDAYLQSIGDIPESVLNLQGIIDTGSPAMIDNKDQFFNALAVVIRDKYFFEDRAYSTYYKDDFFVDSAEFTGIMQAVSVEAPEAQENTAMRDFVSGTTKVGVYTVYKPIIHTHYFGKSISWEIPVSYSGEQFDTAVHSEQGMEELVNYIFVAMSNAVTQHRKVMDDTNRNNFIAEKIQYQSAHPDTVSKINLVEAYCKKIGNTAGMTVAQFLNDKDALNFSASLLRRYKNYFTDLNTKFNSEGRIRFTPADEIVLHINTEFAETVKYLAQANTFWKELEELPYYRSVGYWQACDSFDFADTTKIDVKIGSDGTEVNQSGVVAFMADKRAIMHTIVKDRTVTEYFKIDDIYHTVYQFVDKYVNNLTMNALVFTLEDMPAPATGSK